jgi:hypothetical protein
VTAPARTRPRGRSALRWLVPVVLLVAGISAGAGMLARHVYSRPAADPLPVVGPTASPVPATQQPGDSIVRLTADAAEHPDRDAVHLLLQRYFDAINAHRYDRWRTTISSAGLTRAAQSESNWKSLNETTRDGSIVVQRIDPAPGGNLRVLLSFVSTQDPKKAPSELPESCIRWQVVYPLLRENNGFKIDFALENSTPQMEKC